MASFRTGFKIFGELSIKQGLGRIRSFSEDRKPGRWLPEDQWAVRQPGSTCPEPCDKRKKPPKPSKSWLSVCKDPEVPVECDVRHNNCPPPPVKPDSGPWYSLDNLIPKKKQEAVPPPLRTCREEMKRKELCDDEEEVCENLVDKTFPVDIKPEPAAVCIKQEPCPAPVVTLCCPLPKELDIMLWCGQPSKDSSRIAIKCQSDKLPYQEFRPQKIWKPIPFSLPKKSDQSSLQPPGCNVGPVAYAEFKQVEVPKPLYTRYKSVELSNSNFLFCMIDAKCPDDKQSPVGNCVAITPIPNPNSIPQNPAEVKEKKECITEKRLIEVGSCKPVRLKNAPKYTFRPKPTKLIEKRVSKNPCAQHNASDLKCRHEEENEESDCAPVKASTCQPPKVLTGTLTNEPQCFERCTPLPKNPPRWMCVLCKPGDKGSPLVPPQEEVPAEPSCWASETDGLKFYDDNNEGICPKPPPDPCKATQKPCIPALIPEPITRIVEDVSPSEFRNRFVLMPECYNIKKMRDEETANVVGESASFEEFIEAKTAPSKKCSKSYPPMKENILYDLQRMCPSVPFDPSKINAPCRKPAKPDCPQPPRFYRCFSTLSPATFRDLTSAELCKLQRRTECGDSSGKCKVRPLIPKPKECPEKPKPPDCAEITLPCCPKSRIPPSCDVRKPMPPCKKKLPPKPSFSECSKDPPPCPKMTECNCWEKKPPKK